MEKFVSNAMRITTDISFQSSWQLNKSKTKLHLILKKYTPKVSKYHTIYLEPNYANTAIHVSQLWTCSDIKALFLNVPASADQMIRQWQVLQGLSPVYAIKWWTSTSGMYISSWVKTRLGHLKVALVHVNDAVPLCFHCFPEHWFSHWTNSPFHHFLFPAHY